MRSVLAGGKKSATNIEDFSPGRVDKMKFSRKCNSYVVAELMDAVGDVKNILDLEKRYVRLHKFTEF